jgi:hypothetical protein
LGVSGVTHLKKILPFFYCWLACVAIQLPMVWWLYPSPQNFLPTETVEGIYVFDGGGARTGSTTSIGARSLFCSVSYLGPAQSCGQKLSGQFVKVKLARYRHLFGYGQVLVEARAAGGDEIVYSEELRMELWRFTSGLEVVRFAIFFALFLVYPIFKFKLFKFFRRGSQNGR